MPFANFRVVAASALVAFFGAVGLVAFSADAQAAPVARVNARAPVVSVVPSACTGEPVLIAGRAHVVGQLQVNDSVASGHVQLRIHALGRGLVTQSAYVLNGAQRMAFAANRQGQFVGSVNLRARLIALGEKSPNDDGILWIRGHVAVNANGELVSSALVIAADCR